MGVNGGIVLTRAVCIILTVEGLEEADEKFLDFGS